MIETALCLTALTSLLAWRMRRMLRFTAIDTNRERTANHAIIRALAAREEWTQISRGDILQYFTPYEGFGTVRLVSVVFDGRTVRINCIGDPEWGPDIFLFRADRRIVQMVATALRDDAG